MDFDDLLLQLFRLFQENPDNVLEKYRKQFTHVMVDEFQDTNYLQYVTMTEYDTTYKGVEVLFRKDDLVMTLGETIAKAGKRQIRIAETEKYPHVTFFFSGGREAPFPGEERIMLPSPKVATYDLQPEMSAQGIVDAIGAELTKGAVDFVALNFANPDMVGHTGVFDAIVKAVETTDHCVQRLVRT